MAKNYHDITLALGGICQSACLVQQLAHQGNCSSDALRISLNSILIVNPATTLDVFGNEESNLTTGLKTLLSILNSTRGALNTELSRYTFSLIALERRLDKNRSAFNELGSRINQLGRQTEHYDLLSDTIINVLAGIYVDVISKLGPRIQVTGSVDILKNNQIQAKVRAILLAGIRSAVLWQQVGGGRLQLMFARNALVKHAQQILSHSYA
ncbi:high frequency lysogenization protein HflD [Pectobacteriaceae bacterium CE70]|uniref:High frequency lysogenization protein HflD homolog n=1 Tax=Serratia sp. (strain ATCC 39006) TaxID=104623 RepID=A0A2I5TL35_SERS3|nr:high frequency lysogenization protein HflD [Serratia sp. ATCC 39006]WJV64417.1 high frequency lysogenization protein HflD [Pectobacteriaceae bacterium C52]WJV65149.1 high frequency lysogenization protein HflD [Pectobacteriaceae bacterium CE70]WJY09164.1 high frequency lysogenization protein HflD [Pectobacteriaceae bacterium C80]AUH00956.1 lysogenization regulator HflD [Serratia sp. ATCC 39006]AUH05277.1 lysogenization regulator HflD [Serratia sp. ATCC 39006]